MSPPSLLVDQGAYCTFLTQDWRQEYRSSPTYAGHNFLRLRDFDSPSHVSSPALKAHGHSKSSMARYCRAVLDHAPLGSFRKRFFPDEPTSCPECGVLQDRAHVLLKCTRYRRWWELQVNESAFSFADAPS
ncbi:hypothetical protein OH77DRAFT_1472705 [Trametes cingulata]|nr:hypothetical protein OH77DRAFT_1472705 [Trametes cingulata]